MPSDFSELSGLDGTTGDDAVPGEATGEPVADADRLTPIGDAEAGEDPGPGDPEAATETVDDDRFVPAEPVEAPRFSGDDWNVGVNERTGNTVSKWSGGRYYDNMTWEEVEPT